MVNRILELKQLYVFLCSARHQSFKKAASELGMTASAVSQSVAALEKNLETVLFDRTVRPMQLTVKGRDLAQDAARLLAEEKEVRLRLLSPKASFQSLRLGISEAVSLTIGPWFLERLYAMVPDLTVYSSLSAALLDKLSQNQLDVVLCSGTLPQGQPCSRKLAWRERFLLVTSRAVEEIKTLEQFKMLAQTAPFVCYNPDYRDQQRTERILSAMNVAPTRRMPVSSSYELVGLIALSGGFGIVPPTNIWYGREFSRAVRFSEIPLDEPVYRRIWALALTEAAGAQIELVCDQARLQIEWFLQKVLSEAFPGLERFIELD